MNKERQSNRGSLQPNIEKPIKPSQYECCGRGCRPCVFDYYRAALERYKQDNESPATKKPVTQ